MGSRKEEERNEKIIRGLMKLPPNRKCINCNSLGPQYVCTNFWSFVCMTCSGIHREFTHRVKSVSMAKFTSQEVEALQNGGNQRARELYLKDWDVHRQRLPESSNVDKIRQFIKDVYVDKKYSVGKTAEKPPRDTQNRGVCEDDTRRASSYHSFSQSPPYDYQYEDRRYGKQSGSLTRKPGSDRGRYEGKMSSFVYSPGRGREQMYDDRFSNEGSVSRVSDYSASSRAGEPFRYGAQSPPFQISVHGSSEDLRDRATNYFPPRSRSAGSFGSIDSNFMSQTSVNSVGFVDIPQSEQSAAVALDKLPFPESSVPRHSDSLDFFEAPIVQQNVSSSVPPIDLFQLPEAPPQGSSTNAFQPPRASTSAVNLFAVAGQPQSTLPLSEILPDLSASRNEGWATFDTPPKPVVTPNSSDDQVGPTIVPSVSGVSAENLDNVFASLVDTGMQWPSDQDSSFDLSNILSTSWNEAGNTQLWNAFEDPFGAIGLAVGTDTISSTANQHLGIGGASMERQSLGPESFDWAVFPLLGGKERQLSSTDRKSSNPFDLPYEVEVPESNTFMDMSSLHGALPPSSFEVGGDVSQVQPSWHPQNPASPYIAGVAGQGGITYLTPLPPTTAQVPNASASIRGNPFA